MINSTDTAELVSAGAAAYSAGQPRTDAEGLSGAEAGHWLSGWDAASSRAQRSAQLLTDETLWAELQLLAIEGAAVGRDHAATMKAPLGQRRRANELHLLAERLQPKLAKLVAAATGSA